MGPLLGAVLGGDSGDLRVRGGPRKPESYPFNSDVSYCVFVLLTAFILLMLRVGECTVAPTVERVGDRWLFCDQEGDCERCPGEVGYVGEEASGGCTGERRTGALAVGDTELGEAGPGGELG